MLEALTFSDNICETSTTIFVGPTTIFVRSYSQPAPDFEWSTPIGISTFLPPQIPPLRIWRADVALEAPR